MIDLDDDQNDDLKSVEKDYMDADDLELETLRGKEKSPLNTAQ